MWILIIVILSGHSIYCLPGIYCVYATSIEEINIFNNSIARGYIKFHLISDMYTPKIWFINKDHMWVSQVYMLCVPPAHALSSETPTYYSVYYNKLYCLIDSDVVVLCRAGLPVMISIHLLVDTYYTYRCRVAHCMPEFNLLHLYLSVTINCAY